MKLNQELVSAAFSDAASVPEGYQGDCDRICQVAARDLQIVLSGAQAYKIWSAWSDMMSAGWLFVSDDQEIVQAINSFVRARTGVDV